MIVQDVLPNGLRILTESMPDVRSVSLGIWLVRGSRPSHGSQHLHRHFSVACHGHDAVCDQRLGRFRQLDIVVIQYHARYPR